MKNFIVIFRELDGRIEQHTPEAIEQHQQNWKTWLEKWGGAGHLNGGSGLTLNGKIMKGSPIAVTNDIHKVGTEIVGGFLLLKATDLGEAENIMQTCPIFEFDGYAEIREMQN